MIHVRRWHLQFHPGTGVQGSLPALDKGGHKAFHKPHHATAAAASTAVAIVVASCGSSGRSASRSSPLRVRFAASTPKMVLRRLQNGSDLLPKATMVVIVAAAVTVGHAFRNQVGRSIDCAVHSLLAR